MQVLGLDRVGLGDILQLGGDSLAAIRLIAITALRGRALGAGAPRVAHIAARRRLWCTGNETRRPSWLSDKRTPGPRSLCRWWWLARDVTPTLTELIGDRLYGIQARTRGAAQPDRTVERARTAASQEAPSSQAVPTSSAASRSADWSTEIRAIISASCGALRRGALRRGSAPRWPVRVQIGCAMIPTVVSGGLERTIDPRRLADVTALPDHLRGR
jgi:hypothetical protein